MTSNISIEIGTVRTLLFEHAEAIAKMLFARAAFDGGKPISVSVCGAHGLPIMTASMNGASPVSYPVAQNKARSAVLTGRDTAAAALKGTNPANYGDLKLTCFPGGVSVAVDRVVIGGIGVSGRKGTRENPSDSGEEDHELADAARCFLLTIVFGMPMDHE